MTLKLEIIVHYQLVILNELFSDYIFVNFFTLCSVKSSPAARWRERRSRHLTVPRATKCLFKSLSKKENMPKRLCSLITLFTKDIMRNRVYFVFGRDRTRASTATWSYTVSPNINQEPINRVMHQQKADVVKTSWDSPTTWVVFTNGILKLET